MARFHAAVTYPFLAKGSALNKLNFIKLIAKTERPEKVDGAKYGAACRDAVEYAFTHWIGDNGQNHAKNETLIAACVKRRDELLK